MPSNSGPICLSVINMKGGVGKTTIAVSLARVLARYWSKRVLAVDLDPQANMSQALMGEGPYEEFLNSKSPSIVEVFNKYKPPTPDSPSATPLSAPSVVHQIEKNLQILPSRFDFSDRLISAAKSDPRCLARLIADHFQDEDLIIIDCAPTESIFTRAAYHASRYILVPVRPEFFATIGFPLLGDSLCAFRRENRGHQIDVIGIVVNDAGYQGHNAGGPERRESMDQIKGEADDNGWHVFESTLLYSRGFPKMMRGNYTHLGDALGVIHVFANEFLTRLEVLESSELGLGQEQ